MNKPIGISMVVALLLAMCGAAWAEQDGRCGGYGSMMEQADTNHDGKISHDEFMAAHQKLLEERFKKLDTNSDGFIDKDELRKGCMTMRQNMKEHMQDMHDKMQEQKAK